MSFLYLASPYTKYEGGREAAYDAVIDNVTPLLADGWTLYSPILHNHPLSAEYSEEALVDFDFWKKVNLPFMRCADGLVVLKLPGWEESVGVQWEVDHFRMEHKPIMWLEPLV